ncbi:MAG TPA: biotin/lipoyl-binding protein [Ktedonobacterales bacterium]
MDDPQNLNDAPTLPSRRFRSMTDRARSTIVRTAPWRILLVILLVVIAAAALWPAIIAARQPRPAYATAHIGNVILSLQETGVIQATTYQADFPVDGALSEIDVVVGQQVRKGDVLAKLSVAPFQSALVAAQNGASAAQQSLDAAQTAQSQAQVASSSANTSLSAQQAYAQTQCAAQPADPDACGAANAAVARAQAQVDAAQAQVAAAQAQLAAARKSVGASQARTSVAQAQLASATLTAPHNGVVTTINGAVGGRPGATANGIGSFITLMDTGAPLATAQVNYRDIGQIRAGDAATFRVAQASKTGLFTGMVAGVSPQGQGSGDTLSYPVSLRLDPASLGGVTLLPGMTAETTIITHARYHVIVIANSAVDYAREEAPASGEGLLTRSQINAALASARAMRAHLIASDFDIASDPLTPAYLVGFQRNQYVAVPVVLGLTDGHQWEVAAGLSAGQQVVDRQRSLIFG